MIRIPPELVNAGIKCLSTFSPGEQTLFTIMACAAVVFFFMSAAFINRSKKPLDACFVCYGLSVLLIAGCFLMLGFATTCQ